MWPGRAGSRRKLHGPDRAHPVGATMPLGLTECAMGALPEDGSADRRRLIAGRLVGCAGVRRGFRSPGRTKTSCRPVAKAGAVADDGRARVRQNQGGSGVGAPAGGDRRQADRAGRGLDRRGAKRDGRRGERTAGGRAQPPGAVEMGAEPGPVQLATGKRGARFFPATIPTGLRGPEHHFAWATSSPNGGRPEESLGQSADGPEAGAAGRGRW